MIKISNSIKVIAQSSWNKRHRVHILGWNKRLILRRCDENNNNGNERNLCAFSIPFTKLNFGRLFVLFTSLYSKKLSGGFNFSIFFSVCLVSKE